MIHLYIRKISYHYLIYRQTYKISKFFNSGQKIQSSVEDEKNKLQRQINSKSNWFNKNNENQKIQCQVKDIKEFNLDINWYQQYKARPPSVQNHIIRRQLQTQDYMSLLAHFNKKTGEFLQEKLIFLNNRQTIEEYLTLINVIVIIVDLNISISNTLFKYLLCNTLTTNHFISKQPSLSQNLILAQWLSRNKDYFLSIIAQNDELQEKLMISMLFKRIFAQSTTTHLQIGEIALTIRSYLRGRIRQLVEKLDFSEIKNYKIIRLFDQMMKQQPITSQEKHFQENLETKILYFDFPHLVRFIIDFPAIISMINETTLANLLSIIELSLKFNEESIQQHLILKLLNFLYKISLKNQELHFKAQQIYHILFRQVFNIIAKDNKKFSKNFIFDFLIQISKEIQLETFKENQQNSQQLYTIQNFFLYLNSLILENKGKSKETIRHNLNIIFELLSLLIKNRFFKLKDFQSYLNKMMSNLSLVLSKQQKLNNSYLLALLNHKLSQEQIITLIPINDVNLNKFMKYIQIALNTQKVQMVQKIFFVILNSRNRHRMLNLSRILQLQQYQHIISSIISIIIKKDQQIIRKGIQYIISSQIQRMPQSITEVFKFFKVIPDFNHQHILSYFLKECLALIQYSPDRLYLLFKMSHFFLNYVTTLNLQENLFSCPYYYHILNICLKELKSPTFMSIFQYNIYKILSLMMLPDNKPFILNSIFSLKINSLKLSQPMNKKFKHAIYPNSIQHEIIRYRLNQSLTDNEQIKYLFEKIVQKNQTRVHRQDWNFILKKYCYFRGLRLKPIKQDLTLIFMHMQNGHLTTFFNQNKQIIDSLIQHSSQYQLSQCLYNYNFANQQPLKKKYFFIVFNKFLNIMQNVPKIHCIDIIYRFLKYQSAHGVLNQLLNKMLLFYSVNLQFYTASEHKKIIYLINYLDSCRYFDAVVKKYLSNLKKYVLSAKQISRHQKYSILQETMYKGQHLSESQLLMFKKQIFQSQNSFYLIIHHEDYINQSQYQSILAQYMAHRNDQLKKINKIEVPLILNYMNNKYKHLVIKEQVNQTLYNINFDTLNALNNKQQLYLNTIKIIYPEVHLNIDCQFIKIVANNQKLFNKEYVLAFCQNRIQPIQKFLEKALLMHSSDKNTKIILLDTSMPLIKTIKYLQYHILNKKQNIAKDVKIILDKSAIDLVQEDEDEKLSTKQSLGDKFKKDTQLNLQLNHPDPDESNLTKYQN